MKHRLLTVAALLCLFALPLGCAPQEDTPTATTITADTTTKRTASITTTTAEEALSSTEEMTTTTQQDRVTTTTTTTKKTKTTRTYQTITRKTTVRTTTVATTATSTVKPTTATTKPSTSVSSTSTSSSTKPRTDGNTETTVKATAATTTKTTAKTTDTTAATTTTTTTKSTTSSRETVTSRSSTEATTTTKKPIASFYPVTPSAPIAESSQRIHNNAVSRGKIASEVVRVTEFDPEWAFMHHPAGIVYFKGKFYAAFSRGETGEDFPGQHMAISSSEDFYNWTEPEVLVKAEQGTYGQRCIIPCGLYVAGDKMIAYYYDADYDEKWFNKNGVFNPAAAGGRKDTIYQIITTDGVNWTRQRISSTKAVGGLRQMSTGRWGSACGVWFHHTDSAIPDPNNGNTWKWYVMPEEMRAASEKRNGARLTESSWYESADGVIHLMIRSDKGYQWNAESYDGGVSFTEFYPTRVSSDNTQFNFMNLKDGRALGIGTPNEDGDIWGMWPLNLYVSEDGYNFDTVYTLRDEKYTLKQQGYSKGGQYAYMKMLEHDGYLYVFYSRMKEVMELTRVKVSDIKY